MSSASTRSATSRNSKRYVYPSKRSSRTAVQMSTDSRMWEKRWRNSVSAMSPMRTAAVILASIEALSKWASSSSAASFCRSTRMSRAIVSAASRIQRRRRTGDALQPRSARPAQGRPSTARRRGSSAIMRARSSPLIRLQAAISARVRPHPMQSAEIGSSVHTLLQGLSMPVMSRHGIWWGKIRTSARKAIARGTRACARGRAGSRRCGSLTLTTT